MWPWEHLAFAYLLATGLSWTGWRSPPSDVAAVAVAVGSQLPDLIDKPLAWWFGVVASGRSMAHSLLFVAVLLVVVGVLSRRLGAPRAGALFGIAVLSHLAGDVIYPLVVEGELRLGFLFWPFVTDHHNGEEIHLIAHVLDLFADFVHVLGTPGGTLLLAADLVMFATAVIVWVHDGLPGLDLIR